MAITRELWVAYTRIFFVEAAYWIISIGMVFINEFILSQNILTEDLTVFITIFQILFSLSILLALNHITKHYFLEAETDHSKEPFLSSNQGHHYQQVPIEQGGDSSGGDDDDDVEEIDVHDVEEGERLVGMGHGDKIVGRDITMKSQQLERRRQASVASSSVSSQDGLMNLLIVNIPNRMNLEQCKVVFPLSILYIGMLLLNNFCLKYVGVAFYFVSRSLTTVFNVIFTYFLINDPPSRGALACCGFIVLGFILGIDQESVIGSLSVIGVTYGVASSLFTSLFSIYTKKTLAKLDRNIWTLVLYNNINAILLCTPLLIVHGDIQALISDKVIQLSFWTLLSISGVMAFFISIVTNASIKYTSPLTHNISGTAKACLQTVMAVIYYQDHKSTLWWLSNIIILIASAAYSRIKQLEMERRTAAQSASQAMAATTTTTTQTTTQPNLHHKTETAFRRDSSSSGCSATSAAVLASTTTINKQDSFSVKFQPAAN